MNIEIITSVCMGILDNLVVKVDGKIVKDFKQYHFDWDCFDTEDTAYSMGELEDCTIKQAYKHHEELICEHKNTVTNDCRYSDGVEEYTECLDCSKELSKIFIKSEEAA